MKFLMVYPNNTGNSRVPLGIVYLLTILKKQGHDVRLFDMTFYGVDVDKHHVDMRARNLNFRPVDLTPYGVTYARSTMEEVKTALIEETQEFKPDVVGISIVEDTSMVGFELANAVKREYPKTPFVFGGAFCMANPKAVLECPAVDVLCIGEGEVALPELLQNLERGKAITEIQGLWIRKADNVVVKQPVGPPLGLDELPLPDLSFIDDRHFYGPMAGHVYRMVYVASHRGCPRRCTYCNNQMFLNTYRQHLKAYLGRNMSIPRLIEMLVYLKETYGFNFFQIVYDDFTLRSLDDLERFRTLYKHEVDLPFWIQAEANNVTEEKIRCLKEAGCIAIAIGIETGNEFVRREVYKRRTSREATIRAFDIMHEYGIRTSGNIIMGVPYEGRKEIFDSIELVRRCQPRALNVNVFAPYCGTRLRDYCVEKGYLDEGFIHDGRVRWGPVLDLPQITKDEIEGLMRTFALYATLPKKYLPMIAQCEDLSGASEETFSDLENIYWRIVGERGMDYDVPGFDYDGFLQRRRMELVERTGRGEPAVSGGV